MQTDFALGYGPLIREYVFYLLSKLGFHRHHPEFNGERKETKIESASLYF